MEIEFIKDFARMTKGHKIKGVCLNPEWSNRLHFVHYTYKYVLSQDYIENVLLKNNIVKLDEAG